MNAKTIAAWLRGHAAAWPADSGLALTQRLRKRLASLPDEISGVSLKVLKDTALPAWRDDGLSDLTERLTAGEPPAGEAALRDRLRALPVPAPAAPLGDAELATVLSAARVLRGAGEGGRAAELLGGSAAVARRLPERTFFALWMVEVARSWLDDAAPPALRSRVEAELGGLLVLVGDITEGIELIGSASRRLFQAGAALPTAWLLRCGAAQWGLRTRTTPRAEAVAELKKIHAEAPEASEAWFHAGFELIFASASPGSQAADLAEADRLTRRLNEAVPPGPARDDLLAHAHEVLGRALHFGNNRLLHTQARDEDQQAVALYRAARDWPSLARGLDALGRIQAQLGEHAAADKAFEESIALKQQVKDLWGMGASFNGLATSLMRRGRPLDALPFFQANLALLGQTPGAATDLIIQNFGQQVTAYLSAYQNPFAELDADRAAADLRRAEAVLDDYACRMEGQPGMKVSAAYHKMLRGALGRLEARLAADAARRRELLAGGAKLVRESVTAFRDAGVLPPLPNAYLYLAGLLTDTARALDDARAREAPLREARESLRAAEDLLWDSYERAYLELEWAWYYRTTGPAASAENHLTSARLHAQACGNRSIEADVGTSLGTHLRGPAGTDRWDVVLPPGTKLEMPIFALDWRGRPVPGYDLHAFLVGPAADAPRVSLSPADGARTDALGRATFTLEVPADARTGVVEVEVRDHGVFREAHAHVHVQPFEVRLDPSLASHPLDEADCVVLRHLFGPRFCRAVLRKEFGSGLSGSRVLLVEPTLAPPPGADGARAEGLRGQPCLVKIGSRRQMQVEVERYEEHVKDILPPNVSRIASHEVWGDRAGIRMSLAGDQDWDRALPEIDWLRRVPAMETHHLLGDLFIRDLGSCWYHNSPVDSTSQLLYRAYGRTMPAMLTIREPHPGGGLLPRRPRESGFSITQGLRPPGEDRLAEPGQIVYLGELRVGDVAPRGDEWEYELVKPSDGLRVLLRTRVPPRYYDKDGVADNLIGQQRHVLGVVEEFAFDRLLDALRVGVATCPVEPGGEGLALSDDGTLLEVRTRDETLSLGNPLFSLYKYLEHNLLHRRSIIHGDLHSRNVIVSPRGMPYYIDFSDTGVGPTLFDFVKHEAYLWSWSLAGVPDVEPGTPEADTRPPCTLTEAVRLMRALTRRGRRFPAALTLPDFLSADRRGWPAKFYQVIGSVRALARDHSASPPEEEAPDYFLPLAIYSALMLRWSHPNRTKDQKKKEVFARQGVFLTLLAGLLLNEGW
jgi:hypothetical protein